MHQRSEESVGVVCFQTYLTREFKAKSSGGFGKSSKVIQRLDLPFFFYLVQICADLPVIAQNHYFLKSLLFDSIC